MTTPKLRGISTAIFAVALAIAIVLSVFGMYSFYQPQVTNLSNQLNQTTQNLNTRTEQLKQAQNNITSLQGTINSLHGEISNLQSQISNLESQNSQLQSSLADAQSQVSSLQSQLASLRQPNLIGTGGWANYLCLFGVCTVDFYGAWANTGQNPSYHNVVIQFTAYSDVNQQGQVLCQTTYNLGVIAGQSIVSLQPNGQYASCSYFGSPPGSSSWQFLQT